MPPGITHFFKKTHQKLKEFQGKVAALKRDREKEPYVFRSKGGAEGAVQKVELVVPASTMAKFVVIAIALLLVTGFMYQIRDILVAFFISLLFAAALDPMVDSLARRKIPRTLGVILIYIAGFLFLGLFFSNLVPIVAREVAQLGARIQDFVVNIVNGKIELPQFMDGLKPYIKKMFEGVDISKVGDYRDILIRFANQLSGVAGNVLNAVFILFNGLFNTILIFVTTFLMTIDEQAIDKFLLSMFPARYKDYIEHKSEVLKQKMGYWLRGQVVLCIIVGVSVYIGLFIISLFYHDVQYAATISMVAGITEVVPYAGPLLAWVIAVPIIANQSFGLVIWLTVVMYVVQFLENNFFVPIVMHKAVGISPIFVMFAMLVGFSFLGILGILLSIPVATAVSIFQKDYADKEK